MSQPPDSRSLPTRPDRIVWVTGLLCLPLYLGLSLTRAGSSFGDVTTFLLLITSLFALYATAVRHLWKGGSSTSQQTVRWIWLLAILFRLALLPAGLSPDSGWTDLQRDLSGEESGYRTFLLYDNDVGRYLWDGHVTASGFDPYRFTPAEVLEAYDEEEPWAESLVSSERWSDILESLSYETFGTVYPPLAQRLFQLSHALAPGSVACWKLLLILLDLAACGLFLGLLRQLGRDPRELLVYAWNPLLLKEVAGSAHLDVLVVCLLLATTLLLVRHQHRWAMASLGMAILAKLTPILLVPLFLRRVRYSSWWPLPLVVLLGYLPFLETWEIQLANLSRFAKLWVFNPGFWGLIESASGPWSMLSDRNAADALSRIAVLVVILWWSTRPVSSRTLHHGVLWILGVYVITSSTVMPWYLLWVLPFAILARCRSYLALTGLCFLSYWIYADGVEHPSWLVLEWSLFFLFMAWELHRRRREIPALSHPTHRTEPEVLPG